MAFKDDLRLILAGGIAALIDGPAPAGEQATNNAGLPRTVEQTPPEPQVRDREPFLLSNMNGANGQTLLIGGAIIAAVAVFLLTRK